ncbi:hypothetical protein, partial [Anabaena sp. CCY 0017]|uniref:hypothetical protein n=1 Tax=Anabaena sp. CCY 0017 TaxID=3103866 RepID=UPI0039C658A4
SYEAYRVCLVADFVPPSDNFAIPLKRPVCGSVNFSKPGTYNLAMFKYFCSCLEETLGSIIAATCDLVNSGWTCNPPISFGFWNFLEFA